jgi:hypothetical protein
MYVPKIDCNKIKQLCCIYIPQLTFMATLVIVVVVLTVAVTVTVVVIVAATVVVVVVVVAAAVVVQMSRLLFPWQQVQMDARRSW